MPERGLLGSRQALRRRAADHLVTDPTTTTDALQSGQLDAVYPVIFPIAAAKQKNPSSGNWKLIVQKGGFHQTIYMRADQAPFNDARVRLAMKLIPDRQKMIETVLAGFGEVGNDLFGKHLAGYAQPAAARPGHRAGRSRCSSRPASRTSR